MGNLRPVLSKFHFHKQPIAAPPPQREVWVIPTLWMGKLSPIQLRQDSLPVILKEEASGCFKERKDLGLHSDLLRQAASSAQS